MYVSPYYKAAALMWKIIEGHVFNDANKRTGSLAGLALLNLNQIPMRITSPEIVDIAVRVAQDAYTIDELGEWFYRHAT